MSPSTGRSKDLELQAKLSSIRLVLMDIDGTLIEGPASHLEHVRILLAKLKRHDVHFSIATGRTIVGAQKFLKQIDPKRTVRWIIGYNGGVIATPDASPWIERRTIETKSFMRILQLSKKHQLRLFVYTCSELFNEEYPERVFSESCLFDRDCVDFNEMNIIYIEDLRNVPVDDIVAILAVARADIGQSQTIADIMRNELGENLRITTSGGKFIEIANPKSTKRIAMDGLCTRLGLNINQVMAIGDNFNDLDMLESCGLGVAVANSPQEVKDVSNLICKHRSTRGVVEALSLLVSHLRLTKKRESIERGQDSCP